jgi:hypothetical protein
MEYVIDVASVVVVVIYLTYSVLCYSAYGKWTGYSGGGGGWWFMHMVSKTKMFLV